MSEPLDGYVKLHREFWSSADTRSATSGTRLVFLGLVSFARATGKYRGMLVDNEFRVMGLNKIAKLIGVSGRSFRRAIRWLESDDRKMIEWKDAKGKPCISVVNYDKWQDALPAKTPQGCGSNSAAKCPDKMAGAAKTPRSPASDRPKRPTHRPKRPTGADEEGRIEEVKGSSPPPPLEQGTREEDPEDDLGNDGETTVAPLVQRPKAPNDDGRTSVGGIPPVATEDARWKFGDLIAACFKEKRQWNNGWADKWREEIAAGLRANSLTDEQVRKWLSDNHMKPEPSDMRYPDSWIRRCKAKEFYASKGRGKDRKPIKHREGGRI